MTKHEADFNYILRSNLERVFNERDDNKRRAAIDDLFVEQPVMYDPTTVVKGREAISRVASDLLKQGGPTFRFIPEGAAVGHHGLAHLSWHAGSEGGPVTVTGADVAIFEDGKISQLWVLVNAV